MSQCKKGSGWWENRKGRAGAEQDRDAWFLVRRVSVGKSEVCWRWVLTASHGAKENWQLGTAENVRGAMQPEMLYIF